MDIRSVELNFNRHDADGMGSLYTKGGQLLPPSADVVSDRDGIAAFWQKVFDMSE
ncbi:hypothetical protein ACFO0N_22115 [Halobium salinum]|uniref:SnoaL-like domain-containing protein n=1 Tax=Halobium salinum TaxID=1364940 RepID=A0ABD5PIV8_9EURY|nr:nuclear transport factor 2 family protein [Halobium salinum]